MKTILSGLFITILLGWFIQSADAQDKQTVKMACTNFPPYKIKESDGEAHGGIDLDVMRAAFAQTNRNVEFTFYPWKRSVAMVTKGQADALCGCSYRPEREKDFIFSDMLGEHSQGVFINENSDIETIDNLQNLKGLTIASVRGYAVSEELKQNKNIESLEINDDKQLLGLLNANRVDAIYSYRDIILYRMSFNSNAKKVRYFELSKQPYYLCFSRTKENISSVVDDFNKGLRTIRFNGAYQAIWNKYR